ncbi:cytochrome P450 [Actinomadura spongiicola]|uniref:Cytochrome P450 n=1 Tax=Actinomadura spongiicola TaxID=2303421 RepID=A0A372GFN8_9ACTN|nr:cytochrome P450 [Actinomadura spongiicola]RFS84177.1 cytochrome P450 [Actinomadura spongiicola]
MTSLAARWGIHPGQFWLYGRPPEHAVRYDEEMDAWNVYGHAEVLEALSLPGVFSSAETARLMPDNAEDAFTEGDLLQMDPPDHRWLRNVVSHAFTPKVVADLEPRITRLARELLDAVAGAEEFDLMTALAYPLPVTVVAELLGIPAADQHLFEGWMTGVVGEMGGTSLADSAEEQERAFGAAMEHMRAMLGYLREHIAECRRGPRDDLLGGLLAAELNGRRLSDEHIVGFAKMLLIAGYLSTTMLIGNTMLCLDHFPDQMARVRADRALVPGLVEESLRYLSPVAATYRATAAEVRLAGRRIPAGKMVLVWFGAANRDARVFADPMAFDPARTPNPQLGFGRGIHFCLGAPLARMEGRVALNELFDRYSEIHADPDKPPTFMQAPDTTGVTSLPIRVRPC